MSPSSRNSSAGKLPSINQFRATSNGGDGKPYLISSRELCSSVFFLGGGEHANHVHEHPSMPRFLSVDVKIGTFPDDRSGVLWSGFLALRPHTQTFSEPALPLQPKVRRNETLATLMIWDLVLLLTCFERWCPTKKEENMLRHRRWCGACARKVSNSSLFRPGLHHKHPVCIFAKPRRHGRVSDAGISARKTDWDEAKTRSGQGLQHHPASHPRQGTFHAYRVQKSERPPATWTS